MPNLKISRNGILHLDASSPHPIKVCYSNKTLNIKAICKTFSSIPAWSLICAAQKTKKTKHIPSYNWSSPVSQSLNDPEMRLETVMSNGEERTLRCHTHIHSHSHTQITPSVTLPVTSDCWWRWRWHVFKRRTSRVREEESLFFFLFFPIALGHVFISDALSASCSLGAAFSFRELQKHASTATWGRGGSWRTDTSGGFREGENPVARQVVHAGVHNVFHELHAPHFTHSGEAGWKRRRWGTGTWYCKLMIKQVGQAAVWAERLLVVWRCLSTTVRCWKPLLFWVSHLRDQLLQLCISPLKAIIFWLISPSHHYHDHHRHHLHRLPVLVSLHHKVNPCLDSKCLFISSLFRSEKFHSSWIFLQNSDKNKLWTLNYLLYIIIQKGIPAMGCLNAVLDEGWGSYGRDYIGRCYRELCFQCLSSYCCIFCRAEKDMMASRQERWWAL